MSGSEPLEPGRGEPMLGFRPAKLRDIKPSELGLRFGFGAGVSVVAEIIGKAFNPTAGGMFLAFPAILPATLTLLERKHGTEDAVHDDRGAVLGTVGLVVFAIVAAGLFGRAPAPWALAAATAGWVSVSIGLYAGVAAVRAGRDRDRSRSRPRRSGSPARSASASTRSGDDSDEGRSVPRPLTR